MRHTRREVLQLAAFVPVVRSFSAFGTPQRIHVLRESAGWVEHIPVMWIEPVQLRAGTNAVIWLSGFNGTKEVMSPYLQGLAQAGFLAVSFDHWHHGERGTETAGERSTRVFANFRKRMWPILGNSILDTSRVIDWMQATFSLSPRVHMGGFSLGGDVGRCRHTRLVAARHAGSCATRAALDTNGCARQVCPVLV
jgi:hypothetical protein